MTVQSSDTHSKRWEAGTHLMNRRGVFLIGAIVIALSMFGALSIQAAPQAQQPAASQPSGSKPNILVIFGDDIGQTNISAYSFGVDRLQDAEHRPHRQGRHDVHRLLRRARAARRGARSFITGQAPLRTGLSKVGIPARRSDCRPRTSRSPRRSSRSATRPASSARTISATATSTCRPFTASTSSSAISIT